MVTAAARRQLLPMVTAYFQLVGRRSAGCDRAIWLYELVKSSPGLMGAVIDRLMDPDALIPTSFDQLAGFINVVYLLSDRPRDYIRPLTLMMAAVAARQTAECVQRKYLRTT